MRDPWVGLIIRNFDLPTIPFAHRRRALRRPAARFDERKGVDEPIFR
jgi:hypothetical protein